MVFTDPISKYAARTRYILFNIIQTYVRTFFCFSVEPEKNTRDFLEVKIFTKKSII